MAYCQEDFGRDLKSGQLLKDVCHVHNKQCNRGNSRSYSHETEVTLRFKTHWHTSTQTHTQSCLAFICSIRKSLFSNWWGAALTVNHRQSEGIHLNDSASWKQVHCCQGSNAASKSPGSIKESITALLSLVAQFLYLRNRFGQPKQINMDSVLCTLCFPQYAVRAHVFPDNI